MNNFGEDGSYWPWYHQNLSRMDGEQLLVETSQDGAFLVRSSDTVKGAYVLSLICQNRIHHYRIIPCEDGSLRIESQVGVQAKRFSSLPDLIDYYQEPRRGLASTLALPVQPPQEIEEEESDDDDDSYFEGAVEAPITVNSQPEMRNSSSILSKVFGAALKNQDKSCMEPEFYEAIKTYINAGGLAEDMEVVCSTQPAIHNLIKLVSEDCHRLHKELDSLNTKLEVLKSIFETASGVSFKSTTSQHKSISEDDLYETLPDKLMKCKSSVQGLEDTAFTALKELHTRLDGLPSSPAPVPSIDTVITPRAVSSERSCDGVVTFPVYPQSALQGRRNPINFKINIREGKLIVGKSGEAGSTFNHTQVQQLVKSRSKEQRLGIILEGQGRKDYIFESLQAREHFSQLIQLIRNKNNENAAVNSLSLFIGTWNMGDAPPPINLDTWLMCEGIGKELPDQFKRKAHDIYAIGSQECSKVKEQEWMTKIKTMLKQLTKVDYEKVAMNTLWGMRILILTKAEHINSISHVQMSQVRTGIGNTLGNKGAVGVSFYFGNTSFCFINSHLTSGNEKCHRRNNNFHDILKGLVGLKQKKQLSTFDLTLQFHHLFWFGDLNYRVDLAAEDIIDLARAKDYYNICKEDQLRKEKDKGKVFVGFDESPILFPPTYRYKTNINHRTVEDYVWVKHKRSGVRINVPSFCDRVLWRSYPGTYIVNLAYGCTNDIYTSDHSPMYSVFTIEKVGQHAGSVDQPLSGTNRKACIVVKSCRAEIATNSKATFYLELHSQCFEGQQRSFANKDFHEGTESGKVGPIWNDPDKPILEIHPIIADPDYLELQHILISIKSKESDESYAECCVSLRNLIGDTPEMAVRPLTHSALAVGEIELSMHVTVEGYKRKSLSRQTTNYYQMDMGFIKTDDDHDEERRQRVTSSASECRTSNSAAAVRNRNDAMRDQRTQSAVNNRPPPAVQRRTQPLSSSLIDEVPPAIPQRNSKQFEPITSPNGHAVSNPMKGSAWKSLDVDIDKPALPPKRKSYHAASSVTQDQVPPVPKRLSSTPPTNLRFNKPGAGNSSTLPSRPKIPAKPVILPRTVEPKTVEELLELHNATKYIDVLIKAGYDDIKFIGETADEELEDIGIVDSADRQQLLRIFAEYASKYRT